MDKTSIRVRTGQSIKDFIQLGSRMRNIGVLNVKIRKITDSEVHREVLNKYYQLLVDTNYLGNEAYEVMVLRKSYKEILKSYPNIAESYLRNIIYKEAKRVFSELGCDPYQAILDGELTDEDGKGLINVLHKKILENGKRGDVAYVSTANNVRYTSAGLLTDQMNLDFKKYATLDGDYIQSFNDEEMFAVIAKKFQILSKSYFDNLMKDIDERLIGYYMYLLNTDEKLLTEKQRGQRQQLREVWWLSDVD
ncbi:hypothetical protein [Bacillus cereus]|uniref:hypothetical protein n=1 Tax=Bacillus cereus TaxID=1396 RepID=UPI001C8C1935|nr:hypothetical protein [Bacillus cereus]MBX9158285.1 hypothetical protein [Bacillus cereus]